MPTLGINVRDSMLGLLSFSSNWGSFDIDLRKYTIKEIIEHLKMNERNYFEDINRNFMAKNILKNASINLSKNDINKEKIDNFIDFAPTKYIVQRKNERIEVINDIYIKPKSKSKRLFTEEEMIYPTKPEAISGKFKVNPIFKKEGQIYVEMTEYPESIIEGLS